MSRKLFTPDNRAAIVARVELGLTFADAAAAAGIKRATAKGWLARGRREEEGAYADFAAAVERAREAAQAPRDPMTEAELRLVVSEFARAGNVQAMKLYWEFILADRKRRPTTADPLAELDELAQRRAARQS